MTRFGFIITFLLLSLSSCKTKHDSTPESFFLAHLDNIADETGVIIVSDFIGDELVNELRSSIQNKLRATGNKDTIQFSPKEKKLIIESLMQLEEVGIKDLLPSHAVVIPADSLKKIKPTSSQEVQSPTEANARPFYSFSRPILLRDGSICVFYSGYNCGKLCGEGKFIVYKRTWLGWKPYVTIYGWMS